jgi:hypothetical protein
VPTLNVINLDTAALEIAIWDKTTTQAADPPTYDDWFNPDDTKPYAIADIGGGKGNVQIYARRNAGNPWTSVENDYVFSDGDPAYGVDII